MRHFLLVVFLLSITVVPAQNLVYNPGMEQTPVLEPSHKWNTNLKPASPLVDGWITPTSSTSDFFNSDGSTMMGYSIIKAHSGQGRIGFIAGCKDKKQRKGYKEYMMGRLTRALERDKHYCVRFYLGHDHSSKYAMDSIGIYFSPNPINSTQTDRLKLVPQIVLPPDSVITGKDGWVEVSGKYLANGGEKYFIIGSFSSKPRIKLKDLGMKREKKTMFSQVKRFAYYYADDVSVVEIDSSEFENCASVTESVEIKASRFLFLVDVSGSMNVGGNLDSVKKSIVKVVDDLPDHAEVAIVSFSSEPRLVLPFTSPSEKTRIEMCVDSLKPRGMTSVAHSIEFTYNYIEQNHNEQNTTVILFTDGVFDVSPSVSARIKKNYEDNGIHFSTLQFGDRVNNDLYKLASVTKGEYVEGADNNIQKALEGQLYTKVKHAKKDPASYTAPHWGIIFVRPIRYWLFAIIAYAVVAKYVF